MGVVVKSAHSIDKKSQWWDGLKNENKWGNMSIAGQHFARHQTRVGPVPTSTRFWQAIGSWPETFKNIAFNTYLLFYYSQLLGLSASMASLALALALVVDAVTDPLAGSLSDNLSTRLGRRHPLMYLSILPLGISLWLVFTPPTGLEGAGLFTWLLVTVIAARVSLTFFVVPWNALFYEFTDDYEERTQILTWRYAIGWIGGLIFVLAGWTFIFPSSAAFEFGQFNIDAYKVYGPVLGGVVALAAFITTHKTRKELPYLYVNHQPERFGFKKAVTDVLWALRNRNFMRLFFGILLGAIVAGTGEALNLYMNTYFWELKPEDMRWFGFAIGGAILAFVFIPVLQQRFDKKHILFVTILFLWVNGAAFVGLRLLDLLPANGSDLLLWLLVGNVTLRAGVATAMGIIFGSMVADILDEQQLITGQRQEGVFSAALAFSGKLTSAVGVMVGGLVLDYLVKIPTGTAPTEADHNAVITLGVVDALIVPLLLIIVLWLISGYTLTRKRHGEIRAALISALPENEQEKQKEQETAA